MTTLLLQPLYESHVHRVKDMPNFKPPGLSSPTGQHFEKRAPTKLELIFADFVITRQTIYLTHTPNQPNHFTRLMHLMTRLT